MYEALNGFNVKLAPGETWDESNGGKVMNEEVRFEKGETIYALPQLTREGLLLEARAVKKIEIEMPPVEKAKGRKAGKDG
ncbi:MAG: hypothetical protein JW908_00570 [Anaerolineales bacterium]|nr:hypothetical protein [Anaerolineales bacterium]